MMNCCFSKTSLNKKYVMAISGLMLMGFVFAHLLGNLSIFLGPHAINSYALALKNLGELLWVARIVLLGALIAHVITAIKLVKENRSARPIGYRHKDDIQASYAAKTMMMSGVIVAAFIIYHLLHFTFLTINPEFAGLKTAEGHHDVYSMVIMGFREIPVSVSYIIAIALLSLHLSHGFSSLFQSLGLSSKSLQKNLKCAARAIAILIFIGYTSIPVSVLVGILRLKGTPV